MIYFGNFDFDLEIGGMTSQKANIFAHEMEHLLFFLASKNDTVVTNITFDQHYESHLNTYELARPHTQPHCLSEKTHRKEPLFVWGWNNTARNFARKIAASQKDYPSTDTVKKINSREYCYTLQQKHSFGVPLSQHIFTSQLLSKQLNTSPPNYPFVVKSNYGNAGFGITVIDTEKKLQQLQQSLKKKLRDKRDFILEPWLTRIRDISTIAMLDKNGNLQDIFHYEALVSSKGSFIGNKKTPSLPENILTRITTDLSKIASDLHQEGYFGPLGVDSFTYQFGTEEKLASIIEINGRHTMGFILRSLHNTLTNSKNYTTLLSLPSRQYALRNYTFPTHIQYCPSRKTGALLLSPLSLSHDNGTTFVTPYKYFVLLCETSYEKISELHEKITTAMGGKKS